MLSDTHTANILFFLYCAIHKWTSAHKEDSHKNWGVKPTSILLFSILFVRHRQFKPDATECVVSTIIVQFGSRSGLTLTNIVLWYIGKQCRPISGPTKCRVRSGFLPFQFQTVWIKIRPNVLGLIWFQLVFKDYQQLSLVDRYKPSTLQPVQTQIRHRGMRV